MSELDGFEVLPTFDLRTNRGKIGYRSRRIAELEERVAELERMLEHDRLEILCYEDDVDMRDELIRDMARELRELKDGGISTDCMEYERRMRELGIEVES